MVSIDSSAVALELLEKNLTINSFEGNHESIKENVLTWLGDTDMMFDIVIVDPPAFCQKPQQNAIAQYKPTTASI